MHAITIKTDDLRGAQTIALLEAHRQNMFEHSPPECVFVLDLEGLRQPEITFWSAWDGDEILGCGAHSGLHAALSGNRSRRRLCSGARPVRAPWLCHLWPVCRLCGRSV